MPVRTAQDHIAGPGNPGAPERNGAMAGVLPIVVGDISPCTHTFFQFGTRLIIEFSRFEFDAPIFPERLVFFQFIFDIFGPNHPDLKVRVFSPQRFFQFDEFHHVFHRLLKREAPHGFLIHLFFNTLDADDQFIEAGVDEFITHLFGQ